MANRRSGFFILYLGFTNIRGFSHALKIVRGDYANDNHSGEVSHFRALATAVSGIVGIGNIGGVAIVMTIGGPSTFFWLLVVGFLGMSTKFAECVLAVKYRKVNADGSISGGSMYYLEEAFRQYNLDFLANPVGLFTLCQ